MFRSAFTRGLSCRYVTKLNACRGGVRLVLLSHRSPCGAARLMCSAVCPQDYSFGPHTIHASEVFAESKLSFAFVNLKPVVPGHVLISPKRVVPRFAALSVSEVADLWTLAQRVGAAVEPHFGATSLTLTIQDGEQAGQSVPHVHVHCLPRRAGDFANNDEVYDAIDEHARAHRPGERLDLDAERRVRTRAEMVAEADVLRRLL